MRRHGGFWRRAALAVSAAAAAAAVIAATGQAADPDVSVTAANDPPVVSAGLETVITFTLDNSGNATLTNTSFASELPAGAVFDSVSSSQGICSESAGEVTCQLGNIAGQTLGVVVEIRYTAPLDDFLSCGTFTFKEAGQENDASHLDTVSDCADVTVNPANDPNFRAGCVDAGGSVSTGSTATSVDPQNTTVTTPDGGCITATEFLATGPTEACGVGFKCKTQISEVLTPPCSVDDPCTATVTFDGKTFGKPKNIFKDGELVPPCIDPVKAIPDACLASKEGLPGGDTRFVVRYGIDIRLRGG